MIKHISFDHGWFYHYRIHSVKAEKLCDNGFSKLKNYLEDMFSACPDKHFTNGPRSSKLRFNIDIKPVEIENHEVCALAENGLNSGHYRTAHSNVQMFMLQNDNKTLGVEVPVWLESSELEVFKKLFDSDNPLSGHIDALRVEDGKIWVWDYKPKAHLEKFAHTQVFFYALMLSKRTGIPLDEFMCGYFDENTSFVFKPDIALLKF